MFTVLFAIGRTPGWLAHWREMVHGDGFRIARPRQIYQGPTQREWVNRFQRDRDTTGSFRVPLELRTPQT
jgi:citrate synthase